MMCILNATPSGLSCIMLGLLKMCLGVILLSRGHEMIISSAVGPSMILPGSQVLRFKLFPCSKKSIEVPNR
jgi:hypothetical protein